MTRSTRMGFWGALVAGVAVLAASVAAQPAPGGGPGARGQRGGGMLIERFQTAMADLDLNEDQKFKIDEALEEARSQMREMMPQLRDMDPQERRAKMREVVDQLRSDVSAVLTDEQKATLQERLAALPGQGPATRPIDGQPGRAGAFQGLVQALEQLNLTDAQKSEIAVVTAETREKLQALREQAAGDPRALAEQARPLMEEARTRLGEILTEDQRQQLQQIMSEMPQRFGPDARPGRGAAGDDAAPDRPRRQRPRDGAPPAAPPGRSQAPGGGESLAFHGLDGKAVQLSSFQGRVVVLVFGSLSSPFVRERLPDLEGMRREVGLQATVLFVYTAERHPAGAWDVQRNRDSKMELAAHATLEDRLAAARRLREEHKPSYTVVVDSMDDAAVSRFGMTTPGAVLLGRDGREIARQNWFDPASLGELTLEAARSRPTTRPS